MNKRLEAIRRLIPQGRGVIDVGTDHGYLPVQLHKDGYSGRIIASDIRSGPLAAAKATAGREDALDAISFYLCDGLDACPPDEVDTIVIAGMGGDTICGILDRAEWCMSPAYLLILQPMTKPEVLRFWLINNGFAIEREDLVQDGGTIYQLFSARFKNVNSRLSDAELYLGAYDLLRAHPLFPEYLARQRSRLETRLAGLRSGACRDDFQMRFLQNIAEEMREMEERLHDNGG